MGAFEGLFLMSFLNCSFYSTAFLPRVSLQCTVTWHKDCLHCVISQTLSFSYVFCIKVTLAQLKQHFSFKNSSLERTDHQPTEEHDDSMYSVCAFAAICAWSKIICKPAMRTKTEKEHKNKKNTPGSQLTKKCKIQ